MGTPKGLGSDLIEIDRIRQSIERHGQHFLNRIFTQREQDYCFQYRDPIPHFAGRFAAKEAVAKAFGTGFGALLYWNDIEILPSETGQPLVFLSKEAQSRFNDPILFLSISHNQTTAFAVALWS